MPLATAPETTPESANCSQVPISGYTKDKTTPNKIPTTQAVKGSQSDGISLGFLSLPPQ